MNAQQRLDIGFGILIKSASRHRLAADMSAYQDLWLSGFRYSSWGRDDLLHCRYSGLSDVLLKLVSEVFQTVGNSG